MNKNDYILILIILIISVLFIILNKTKIGDSAKIYYDGKLVKTINIHKNAEYDVEGYNGNVHIIVKNNEIRVSNENSQYHLCQKNKIKNNGESLICLPNKIIIKIGESKYDTIVGGM